MAADKKVKKVKSCTCYSASYMKRTGDQKRFDNLGSNSWLAWANDTAAHYAAIYCPVNKQLNPRFDLLVVSTLMIFNDHKPSKIRSFGVFCNFGCDAHFKNELRQNY